MKFLLLSVVTLMFSVSVNSLAAPVPGVTDTEIKLGNHSQQTGQLAVQGVIQRVMKAYFENVNEQGGIHGRKINFLIGDSGGNPQQALQVIKKQVESDNVFAVVAGQGAVHRSVYKYLREKKVPDLWVNNGTPEYSIPPHPNTFQYTPLWNEEADYYVKLIAKKWPQKKVGILYIDDQTGAQTKDVFVKGAEGKFKIVATEAMEPGAPTPKSQVLNLKKAGAEVIYSITSGPPTSAAIKFAYDENYKPQWLIMFNSANVHTIKMSGPEAAEGVISWHHITFEEEAPGMKKHKELLKTKLPNEQLSTLTLVGHSIGELTVETLKRAGKDLTRESVLKAAESFKDWMCEVCRSSFSTSPTKHNVFNQVFPVVVKNGKWVDYKE